MIQGEQVRSFTYDSLSRLLSEHHPESGTTVHAYDDNSNPIARIDNRGKRTDWTFDSLNRVLTIDYSDLNARGDDTPSVTYSYDDTATNGVGRLATVTEEAVASTTSVRGFESYGYDQVGRISSLFRNTFDIPFRADYQYNLIGGITQASYPDTQGANVLLYEYDDQGRQSAVTGTGFGFPDLRFVEDYSFTYNPTGAVETLEFLYRNPATLQVSDRTREVTTFNNRLQPILKRVNEISATATERFRLDFDFTRPSDGANNGNVWSVSDTYQSLSSLEYDYDFLNRITEAKRASSWTIAYSYDRYGNRLSAGPSTGNPPGFTATSFSVDERTNRLTAESVSGGSFLYDSVGNLSLDGGFKYLWDAENRLRVAINQSSGLATTNIYDHIGRRVVRLPPGTDDRRYVYDISGQVLWEFPFLDTDQDTFRLFLNGRIVFENKAGEGLRFFHTDHLGTVRAKINYFNVNDVNRDGYTPFGQALNPPADTHKRRFTGKERDPETGLDYFGARFCDSVMGRFTSVDPLLDSADLSAPQTWNRYSYVRNNPIRFIDPDGEDDDEFQEGMVSGIINRASSVLSNAWDLVNNPAGAVEGVVFLAKALVPRPDLGGRPSSELIQLSTASAEEFVDKVDTYFNGSSFERGEILGEAGVDGIMMIAGTKGFGQLGKVIQAGRANRGIGSLSKLGRAGRNPGIREVVGTVDDARKLFDQLRGSNKVTEVKPGVLVADGRDGGFVTFRPRSRSGPPTVDVNGIEEGVRKIKFIEDK